MRKLFVCLLVFTLVCPSLLKGDGPDPKQIAKIKKKVASCLEHQRRVTVETYDDRLFEGSVIETGADTFVLMYNGRSTTVKYEDVKKIKWPSDVPQQAKVALGVAAVVGVLLAVLVILGGLKG